MGADKKIIATMKVQHGIISDSLQDFSFPQCAVECEKFES